MNIKKLMGRLYLGALLAGITGTSLADDWQAGAPPEWRTTLEAAKREGPIVVAGSAEFADILPAAFERDTGLKLAILTGTPNELESRLVREARAKNPTIDLFFGGGTTILYVREGLLEPIGPMLMLPGVTNPSNWRDGELKFQDKEKTWLLIPSEYVPTFVLINTDLVKAGAIENWEDLLKPEWKGKITAYDPTVPGPGASYAAFLATQYGMDFVKRLYNDQETRLVRVARQLVEWVVRGTYAIALSADSPTIERFREQGVTNIAVASMEHAPRGIHGGQSVMMIPKGMPHPNATKIFVNWFASQPGQEVFREGRKVASRRRDVSIAGVPDYVIPKEGTKYFDLYVEDFYFNVRPKVVEEIVKSVGR